MNARLYDAVLGRFLAADPFVSAPDFTQDYNRYAYAWNNPMMYVDPSGEQDTYPGEILPPKSDPWNQPWNPEGGAYPGAAGPGFNYGLGYTYNGYGGYGSYGGNFTYNSSTGMNGLGGLIVFGGILIYDLKKKDLVPREQPIITILTRQLIYRTINL